MRAYFFGFIVLFLALANLPGGSDAQGLTAFIPKDTTVAPSQNIEEIMRQAKENGVGVVVIDSEGNLRSQAPAIEDVVTGPDEPEHSALMKMQDSAVKFRSALLERLLQLPEAFQEVLYILRAASPDGTLWAFGKALIFSLLMFAVGVLVEREIFAKRIAKRHVTARILANPQGYSEKMPFLVYRFVMGVVGILVSMAVLMSRATRSLDRFKTLRCSLPLP